MHLVGDEGSFDNGDPSFCSIFTFIRMQKLLLLLLYFMDIQLLLYFRSIVP